MSLSGRLGGFSCSCTIALLPASLMGAAGSLRVFRLGLWVVDGAGQRRAARRGLSLSGVGHDTPGSAPEQVGLGGRGEQEALSVGGGGVVEGVNLMPFGGVLSDVYRAC